MRASAISAVAFVMLLALACPASAQIDYVPIGPRGPLPPADSCLPVVNGFVVWAGSTNCFPTTTQLNVPTASRVGLIRYRTVQVLTFDLADGTLTSPLSAYERNWVLSQAQDLEPVFVDRPLYGSWNLPPGWVPNCGPYWCGCANGVGTWPPQINASEFPGQVEALISWEITNAVLGALGRGDLWDTSYVGSVGARVAQQIGGWSQQ